MTSKASQFNDSLPELVQRRSDGLWYTTRRYDMAGYRQDLTWIRVHLGDNYQIRWVSSDEPYLSASYYWSEQSTHRIESKKAVKSMTEDKARLQGEQLAIAWSSVFVVAQPVDEAAVYALARTVARQNTEYTDDVDVFSAFCDGFYHGFKRPMMQIEASHD